MSNWNVAYDDSTSNHYQQLSLYSIQNDVWHYIGPATIIWENCKTSSEVLIWIICHPSIAQVVFSSISHHSSAFHLPSESSSLFIHSLSISFQSELCQLSLRGKNTFSLLSSLFPDFNADSIESSSTLFSLPFTAVSSSSSSSSHSPYLAPEYYSTVKELHIKTPPRAFFLHPSRPEIDGVRGNEEQSLSATSATVTRPFENERGSIRGYEMQLLEKQANQLAKQSRLGQLPSEPTTIIHLVGIRQPSASLCQAMGGVDVLIPRAVMKRIWSQLVKLPVMIVGLERIG